MAVGVVSRNVSPSRGMDVYGHSAVCPFTYIGPTNYQAGGDAQPASAFKLGVVEIVDIGLGIAANGLTAVLYVYNITTNKMQAFWPNGAAAALVEVTNGQDLSGFTALGIAFGRG